MSTTLKTTKNIDVPKPKGLFDHITHIKQIQDPNYIKTLSNEDLVSFENRYMVFRALSMDKKIITKLADIAIYEKQLDDNAFYTLLINTIPKNYKYYKYVKKTDVGVPREVVKCIQSYFKISYKDATDYYINYIYKNDGLETLLEIIQKCGYTKEEAYGLFDI